MAFGINYELVYKVRPLIAKRNDAERKAILAQVDADNARVKYKNDLAKLCNCKLEELDFTNIACMADGMSSHVYKGSRPKGIGKWACVFCGCDDFDD